ncbi:MAG: GNAT family N-acetyltransferase [Okeania sp. SIO2D1]|nr:GNAT family N-acetyltransferase [Okeania sp. SIO2D1]
MQENTLQVDREWFIRPARSEDKFTLQKLIWEFTLTEALELDLRIFAYRLVIIFALIGTFLMIRNWSLPFYSDFLRAIVLVTIVYHLICALQLLSFMLLGIDSNWQRYWVVEVNSRLVGCALLNSYASNSELAYLFVKPAWRRKQIASSLIRHLIKRSSNPLYLACKPKMVGFYAQLGFKEVAWQNLSEQVQYHFRLFRPHPKLWRFPIVIMRHEG